MIVGVSQSGESKRQCEEVDLSAHTLPQVAAEQPTLQKRIEGQHFAIKFSVEQGAQDIRVTALTVDTTHPDVRGEVTSFCLDHILVEAYSKSPRTIEQIIDPQVTDETRLEALGSIVLELCQGYAAAGYATRPVQKVESLIIDPPVFDELEPVFAIETKIGTTFVDLINGQYRKVISVLRNDLTILDFVVVERPGEMVEAYMRAALIGIEWPILDAQGIPANSANIKEAIHDYTYILRAIRGASWARSLHRIASELEHRQWGRSDPERANGMEPFLHEFRYKVSDQQLWGDDISRTPVAQALAPKGSMLRPRQLPDGRVLWLGLERSDPPDYPRQIHLSGFSTSGTEYHVLVSVPRSGERQMRRVYNELLVAPGWEEISKNLTKIVEIPGSRVCCELSPNIEDYPSIVNNLIESITERGKERDVQRGVSPESVLKDDQATSKIIENFLQGRVPFFSSLTSHSRPGDAPGTSWRVDAALDEELAGTLTFTNNLGGVVVLELASMLLGHDERRKQLLQLFDLAFDTPERLWGALVNINGATIQTRLMPEVGADRCYHELDQAALSWQRALLQTGHIATLDAVREIPWWVERLSGDRWQLSILETKQGGFSWKAAHSLVVGAEGVEVAYLSCGERGLLGTLRGARVVPGDISRVFSKEDLSIIIRIIASSELIRTQKELESTVREALPHLEIKSSFSMGRLDPQREEGGLVQIFRSWAERLFGLGE